MFKRGWGYSAQDRTPVRREESDVPAELPLLGRILIADLLPHQREPATAALHALRAAEIRILPVPTHLDRTRPHEFSIDTSVEVATAVLLYQAKALVSHCQGGNPYCSAGFIDGPRPRPWASDPKEVELRHVAMLPAHHYHGLQYLMSFGCASLRRIGVNLSLDSRLRPVRALENESLSLLTVGQYRALLDVASAPD